MSSIDKRGLRERIKDIIEQSVPCKDINIDDLIDDIMGELQDFNRSVESYGKERAETAVAKAQADFDCERLAMESAYKEEIETLKKRVESLKGKDSKATDILEYKLAKEQELNRRYRNVIRLLLGSGDSK